MKDLLIAAAADVRIVEVNILRKDKVFENLSFLLHQ